MSEAIRLLHFADVHIGVENYGRIDPTTGTSTRVRDFLDRLDEVIDYGLEHEADLAIFAGDAFKNRDPEPTQQREFAQRIKRLADAMPTLLLVGNHDMPGMSSKANSLDIFRALDVPGVTVGNQPEGQIVNTKRGPVYLAWMPYPMRNRLLSNEEHRGKSIDELELTLRDTVGGILRQLAGEASGYEMPRILSGHLTVAEAKFGSERTVMLGRDVAVTLSIVADWVWDYVALGHIHKHQDLNPGSYPSVVYSGSLERIDFGEERESKGFCWVELERGRTRWEFMPVAARPFITLRLDVREEDDPTGAVLAGLEGQAVEGAVLRLLVKLRSEQGAVFREREVQRALSEAASVSILRDIEVEARARLGDLSAEALTPLQLLERYFQARDDTPARIEALLAKAEELLRDSG